METQVEELKDSISFMIRLFLKELLSFLKICGAWCEYFYNVLVYYILCAIYKDKPSRYSYRDISRGRKLVVLANGPSLKGYLEKITNGLDVTDFDFSCMNYFAEHELFTVIKPKQYCLADPMFFKKDNRYEKVMHLYGVLNKRVNWKMDLFIAGYFSKNEFLKFSGLNNKNINIIAVRCIPVNLKDSIKCKLYKSNRAMTGVGTVTVLNLFVALNSGYKQIDLYGADMTFFDSMCVDEHNRLCNRLKHFYDDRAELKPITEGKDEPMRVGDYIMMIQRMFVCHYNVALYARSLNAVILNCSKDSMLDCYKRINQK